MEKKKILYIFLLIFFLVSIVVLDYFTKEHYCETDDECILIQAGCCNCNMGGSNTAINNKYTDWWNTKLSFSCKNAVCSAVINDKCNDDVARCVNHTCTVDCVMNCTSYGYGSCPEGCIRRCIPSGCTPDGKYCTQDCGGPGGCTCP